MNLPDAGILKDIELITSRQNQKLHLLDNLLRQKKAREQSGLFALEGRRLCADALGSNILIKTLFFTGQAYTRRPEKLNTLINAAEQALRLDESLAERVSDTKNPQGVFAVCEAPSLDPERIKLSAGGRYLLLHSVRDPGNLGSIVRTAAALGADGLFLCGCAELFSPKVLRSSMGGVWRLPVAVCPDMGEAIERLKGVGVAVFAAALRENACLPPRMREHQGRAVLVGSESEGLPEPLIAACDEVVCLPMHGGSDSLGAAAAAAILLWELLAV